MNRVLTSRESHHWRTPKNLYDALDEEFSFTLDPCPNNPKFNGLNISWKGERVYCNPPYGKGICDWLGKAREASVAVYLLPSRTDTKWFHKYALLADEIRFIQRRLKFEGCKYDAPFPSMILIYKPRSTNPIRTKISMMRKGD